MTEFFAPWTMGAVALLGLNDHVFKARFHNAWTGKLSDLAGCFFLPLFVSALLGLLMPRARSLRILVGGAVTAVVFTALEMSDVAGAMFGSVVAFAGAPLGIHGVAMTRDLTDLWALTLIPVGCWYGLRRMQRQTQTQMENT